jgi:hypothetical protein
VGDGVVVLFAEKDHIGPGKIFDHFIIFHRLTFGSKKPPGGFVLGEGRKGQKGKYKN